MKQRPRRARLALPLAILGAALVGAGMLPARLELEEDPAGARYLPPATRAHAVTLREGATWIVTGLLPTADGWHAHHGSSAIELAREAVAAPPRARWYLLGTDGLGRDLLSRLLRAMRHSVLVAGAAVLLASWIGVFVGTSAGLGGPWRDGALMRATDTLLALPRLLVYLLCAALFGPSTGLVILVVGLTSWPGLARLVRSSARTTSATESVLAARAAGCGSLRLAALHVLPAAAPLIAVTAALRFADAVLLESALSFLGVGSPSPAVSLGGIVASGRGVLAEAWWISLAPGIVIGLLVLSVRQVASRLVAIADPASVA